MGVHQSKKNPGDCVLDMENCFHRIGLHWHPSLCDSSICGPGWDATPPSPQASSSVQPARGQTSAVPPPLPVHARFPHVNAATSPRRAVRRSEQLPLGPVWACPCTPAAAASQMAAGAFAAVNAARRAVATVYDSLTELAAAAGWGLRALPFAEVGVVPASPLRCRGCHPPQIKGWCLLLPHL